ncbi:MAG: hypothetical protein KF868_09065 [Acidobacteria bacterium]|nr:hypothetical protein [Acidobacteriota bacterium]MCW5968314.1 hypothetical protein [Blastocatellales bacterium]
MMLTIGDKVIYPSQGPCRVNASINRMIGGSSINFYTLSLLDGSGGELFVPVDKAEEIGIRRLLRRAEIPKLLGRLRQTVEVDKNWKQRGIDNYKRLSSGSAFDLAEIVESLTKLKAVRSLSFRENWMLEKARKLLVCEIAEVMQESMSEVEKKVDAAIRLQKIVSKNQG